MAIEMERPTLSSLRDVLLFQTKRIGFDSHNLYLSKVYIKEYFNVLAGMLDGCWFKHFVLPSNKLISSSVCFSRQLQQELSTLNG